MKNNMKWLTAALLLFTAPITPSEIEMTDFGPESKEPQRQQERLQQLRNQRYDSFTISDKKNAQTTKQKFDKPTRLQKFSNFFSRIFGESGKVRDALRQHNKNSDATPLTLDETQQTMFKSLRPEQQLEDLNEWSYREKLKEQQRKAQNPNQATEIERTFKNRLIDFQQQIQDILDTQPDNTRQLKYNLNSGQFEYHSDFAFKPQPSDHYVARPRSGSTIAHHNGTTELSDADYDLDTISTTAFTDNEL